MTTGRFWAGRPVLVTGAGGFIGSHLVELLVRAGADVRAFVRYNSRNDFGQLERLPTDVLETVDVYAGDLTNPEAVANAVEGRATVLHLGALIPIPYSYRHPREFVAANVEGTLNVLEAARRSAVERVVQVSTSEVYGTAQQVPISETHRLHPQSPYAASKVASDQLALSFARSFGLDVVVARPFNTFGPRQSARAIIPTIMTQALALDQIELGATAPTRDFLFVEDTAAGLARCAEADGVVGEVFNLGTGVEISIGDLAARILTVLDRQVPIVTADERLRPDGSEVERLVADVTCAGQRLDWQPTVELDEGLRRTAAWIEGSLSSFKPGVYTT
jgi:NAD dependent epimerase/dehydratase